MPYTKEELESQVAAMEEFLGAASRHEKQALAIIKSMGDDVHITVPLRDYTEMSPKDCYELGIMDGVAALKEQINAAIDAAMEYAAKIDREAREKRQWVGLTEEEKHDCYLKIDVWSRCVEAVEAKLKEKNT